MAAVLGRDVVEGMEWGDRLAFLLPGPEDMTPTGIDDALGVAFGLLGLLAAIPSDEPILAVTDPSGWMGLLNDSREYVQQWRQFNMYPQEDFVPGIAYHPDVGVVNVDIGLFYPNESFP